MSETLSDRMRAIIPVIREAAANLPKGYAPDYLWNEHWLNHWADRWDGAAEIDELAQVIFNSVYSKPPPWETISFKGIYRNHAKAVIAAGWNKTDE